MEYRCDLCGHPLRPYGEAGMTCSTGHHFMAADIKRTGTPRAMIRKREVTVYPWLPGAVLGGLALLLELLDWVT